MGKGDGGQKKDPGWWTTGVGWNAHELVFVGLAGRLLGEDQRSGLAATREGIDDLHGAGGDPFAEDALEHGTVDDFDLGHTVGGQELVDAALVGQRPLLAVAVP